MRSTLAHVFLLVLAATITPRAVHAACSATTTPPGTYIDPSVAIMTDSDGNGPTDYSINDG